MQRMDTFGHSAASTKEFDTGKDLNNHISGGDSKVYQQTPTRSRFISVTNSFFIALVSDKLYNRLPDLELHSRLF